LNINSIGRLIDITANYINLRQINLTISCGVILATTQIFSAVAILIFIFWHA